MNRDINLEADYYTILQVEKGATEKEIKKSYKELARQTHPDKSAGQEEKFKKIAEAYEVLSDKDKKTYYDTYSKHGNNYRQSLFVNHELNATRRQGRYRTPEDVERERTKAKIFNYFKSNSFNNLLVMVISFVLVPPFGFAAYCTYGTSEKDDTQVQQCMNNTAPYIFLTYAVIILIAILKNCYFKDEPAAPQSAAESSSSEPPRPGT